MPSRHGGFHFARQVSMEIHAVHDKWQETRGIYCNAPLKSVHGGESTVHENPARKACCAGQDATASWGTKSLHLQDNIA